MANILLIDVDSTIPNLALMKISASHKLHGDQVALNRCSRGFNPEEVHVSCLFSKNRGKALGIPKMFNCPVKIGGYGVNNIQLPDRIEHIMPDYKLYPNMDFSMGYTSRGCIRKCPFCKVPSTEGHIRNHASIGEFWNPKHKKVILLDNNFLASPKWKENIEFLLNHQIKVSICQGLDIRLVNDQNAFWLKQIDSRTITFKTKMYYFAFDNPKIEKAVIQGVSILKSQGISPYKLTFYVLCGFNSSHEEDMHRFEILRSLGVNAYIMKYNDRKDDVWLNHFDRWVNRHFYKVCSFDDYKPRKQYLKGKQNG